MGIYYPQAAVSLRILFENFEPVGSEAFEASERASLNKPVTINVLARSVRVDINDYTEADSCSITLDYKQFPFDPRAIRSLGITIYMANTQGLSNHNEILPTDKEAEQIEKGTLKSNVVFVGFADEQGISLDESRTVNIEGRDFTSLFIDRRRLVSGKSNRFNINHRIDVILQNLISELDDPGDRDRPRGRITVEPRLGGDQAPLLSSVNPGFDPAKPTKHTQHLSLIHI